MVVKLKNCYNLFGTLIIGSSEERFCAIFLHFGHSHLSAQTWNLKNLKGKLKVDIKEYFSGQEARKSINKRKKEREKKRKKERKKESEIEIKENTKQRKKRKKGHLSQNTKKIKRK